MKARKTDKGKITALYERLSRDDDLTGDSNSIIHPTTFYCSPRFQGYALLVHCIGLNNSYSVSCNNSTGHI